MAATRMMARRGGVGRAPGHPGLSISSDHHKNLFSNVSSTASVQSQLLPALPLDLEDVDVDGDQVMITPTISVSTIVNVKPRSRKRKSNGAASSTTTTTTAHGAAATAAEDTPDGDKKTVDNGNGGDEVAPKVTKMTQFLAPPNPRKRKSSTVSPSTDSGFNDSLNDDDGGGKVDQVPTSTTTTIAIPKTMLPMSPGLSPSSSSTSTGQPVSVVTFGLGCDDAEEIWEHMLAMDEKYLRQADLLACHPSLSPQMRAILFDWMMDVCEAYNLHRETLYLSFDYLDRYLAANTGVLKHHLQLIGITALFIAAKVEEIYPPKLSTFAYVTDGACTVTDIVQMENIIMKDLKWRLHPITPSSWTNFFLQIESIASNATSPNRITEVFLRSLRSGRGEANNRRLLTTEYEKVDYVRCMRLLDLSIMDIQSLKFSYSTLAAASMYHVKGRKACLTASSMAWEDLAPCVFWMAPFAQVIAKSDVPDVLPGIPGVADENRHLIQSQCVLLSMLEEVHLKEAKAKLSSPTAKITEGLLTPPRSNGKNPNTTTNTPIRSPRRKITRRC